LLFHDIFQNWWNTNVSYQQLSHPELNLIGSLSIHDGLQNYSLILTTFHPNLSGNPHIAHSLWLGSPQIANSVIFILWLIKCSQQFFQFNSASLYYIAISLISGVCFQQRHLWFFSPSNDWLLGDLLDGPSNNHWNNLWFFLIVGIYLSVVSTWPCFWKQR
jgi:hypothetical protein